jgi:glycosyltransferase 2 family protein
VLAALLVWRLFYLIVPLLAALVVVGLFERKKLVEKLRGDAGGATEGPPQG